MKPIDIPAFPHEEKTGDGRHWYSHPGMTLRDYFAGQALVAMGMWAPGSATPLTAGEILHERAALAYAQADAMLKAREQ